MFVLTNSTAKSDSAMYKVIKFRYSVMLKYIFSYR